MATPQEMVKEFEETFRLKVNDRLTTLSPEERLLRGKLMLEEVMEHICDGLGLTVCHTDMKQITTKGIQHPHFYLELTPGAVYDPVETADGLGDIVVIANGTANRMGIDLDAMVEEIHKSNMSKLGEDGEPMLNRCRYWNDPHAPSDDETRGHCRNQLRAIGQGDTDFQCTEASHLIDPTKPVGKILKGPNYFKPDIARVIGHKG